MYSDLLKSFIINVILPSALISAFGGIMKIPLVGSFISWVAEKLLGEFLDRGIIEFKVVMIDYLSHEAKIAYAKEIEILKEAQNRGSMTPKEEAEFAKRLQDIVKNRPGVVNG